MKKSKNKYILPMNGLWYVEYGGLTKETSHSWNVVSQRYAYDFEIRENDLPYHDDYMKIENYYSYNQDVIAPADGWIVDIKNEYDNTKILKNRPVICDVEDPRGNYIMIKHNNNEYSLIAHLQKNSFKVDIGDLVKEGQKLAYVGNSGNTQGPHIHFQVQNGLDFINSKGIIITFKNIVFFNESKKGTKKYLTNGIYVKNKR